MKLINLPESWGSQDVAGNFVSFAQEKRQKALKTTKGTATGSRTRGGKRAAAVKAVPAKKVAAKPAAKAAAKTVAEKPTMTRGSMKRSAIPKVETTVRDVVTENKMSAPTSSGISKKARTIQIGGLVGRTGGKWHLGKKAGKG